MDLLQRLRNWRGQAASAVASRDGAGRGARQDNFYTVLDAGTEFVKTLIFEVRGDEAVVSGVGRQRQPARAMSEGIIADIDAAVDACEAALQQAEHLAGRSAPLAILGIAGELVRGDAVTVTTTRANPRAPLAIDELEKLIETAQHRAADEARRQLSWETGVEQVEIRLVNAAVIGVEIDGHLVTNPLGFQGRRVVLTLFSAFTTLTQIGALETVAAQLDLTPLAIVAEPYALARALRETAPVDIGAIFLDVGGGTTDVALVRHNGIEGARMLGIGGRAFTRRLARAHNLSGSRAETLKRRYSRTVAERGGLRGEHLERGAAGNPPGPSAARARRDERGHAATGYAKDLLDPQEVAAVHAALTPEVDTWIESLELALEDLARGSALPPYVYLCGGGSALPDLAERLRSHPWVDRLPFSRPPVIETLHPRDVAGVLDKTGLLTTRQDITPMSLAYQAIELQNEVSAIEEALYRVAGALRL
jgi:cell division protein FtsA